MRVSGLSHFPHGQPVPLRDHAVCVSLPTFNDLIGYEEKRSETLAVMRSGYPRFVKSHFITELSNHLSKVAGGKDSEIFFF